MARSAGTSSAPFRAADPEHLVCSECRRPIVFRGSTAGGLHFSAAPVVNDEGGTCRDHRGHPQLKPTPAGARHSSGRRSSVRPPRGAGSSGETKDVAALPGGLHHGDDRARGYLRTRYDMRAAGRELRPSPRRHRGDPSGYREWAAMTPGQPQGRGDEGAITSFRVARMRGMQTW